MFEGFSIIKSFFAGFVHTERGATCSDSRFIDLSTAEECSGAVSYAKSFNSKASFKEEGSWSYNPKGCYIYDSGNMYFNTNTNSTESGKSTTISICFNGNTSF